MKWLAGRIYTLFAEMWQDLIFTMNNQISCEIAGKTIFLKENTSVTEHISSSPVRVTLYSRPGCHLCTQAKHEILAAHCQGEYLLEEIDIDSDPSLVNRFGLEIPVVMINGVVVFKTHLTAADFRREIQRSIN